MAARRADREFDYIVVGAGSAGCAAAAGLAASGDYRVALLEAGPRDRNPRINLPGGFYSLMRPGRLNWNYSATHTGDGTARSLAFPRGRVLGGCSAINGMVYIRGQRQDFDRWQELGAEGWSYADVLPLFRRSEDYWSGANDYHGSGGPIAVTPPSQFFPIADQFIAAAAASGIQANNDFNGPEQAGAGYFDCTIRNGRRCSAARYLDAAPDNLQLLTGAEVARIRFEGTRAREVELLDGARLRAAGEVILCAGAFNSPGILERSGIGCAGRLHSLDISPLVDLPGVGENLQDHANNYLSWTVRDAEIYADHLGMPGLPRTLWSYIRHRRGILANPAALAGAFFRLEDDGATRPDVQVHFTPVAVVADRHGQLRQAPGINASVCLLQPTTRGTVHIRSGRAGETPDIEYNYLAAPSERRRQELAVERLREIINSPPLASHIVEEIGSHAGLTGPDLRRSLLGSLESVHHFCGSCRMGAGPDAVVDARLRVYGTQGLRVADASVMPEIVSGNTHAASMMIGEKLSQLVAQDNRASTARQ